MEKHSKDVKIKIKGLFCFFLLFEMMISSCDCSRTISLETQKSDAQKYLSRINNTPVKSIKMRPSYYPEENTKFGKNDTGNDERIPHQLWHKNGRCPEGTIPIRRIKEEDLLRADSIKRFGKKRPRSIPGSKFATNDDTNDRENYEAIAMEKHSIDVKIKIKGLFCFFLLIEMMISSCDGSRTISLKTQKSDAEEYLSRINKTPVKSIKSPDGDIIDCVDINKQPAFDHPLLKNHSIQMRPNYHPEQNTKFENNDTGNYERFPHQLWQKNGRCPEGTIPIRRIKKEDLLRADSIERFGKKSPRSIPGSKFATNDDTNSIENYEYAKIVMEGDKYYGAKARINLWQPHVQIPAEYSSAQIWIIKGLNKDSGFNTIEAGWHADPTEYGDDNSRLFIYWTSDEHGSTGCYNLGCPGFVQISRDIVLGGTIKPTSSYDGGDYYIDLQIYKSSADRAWWLVYGNDKEHIVGYWPASIFTSLNDGASEIHMGGEVINRNTDGKHTTTEMGSGQFSGEGYRKASYFRNIQIIYGSNNFEDPVIFHSSVKKEKCYNADINIQEGGDWGRHFFYGGPGRNPNCP